ncbi:DNA mismatch repair protein MutS [Mycobacterium colombiense]|nr:DNA mismatch repair protein MutS [Mycobacterium colombiense]
MTSFKSILFMHPDAGAGIDDLTTPECFSDLYLDQIVNDVVRGNADEHLDRYFCLPLHDISAVIYRHDVFRDMERDDVRAPIEAFVRGMRTMRQRLDRAGRLWHPLQRQGWFVYAVEAFCDAVAKLRDELEGTTLSSQGLREFAEYVASYVNSGRFRMLVAEIGDMQAKLSKIRYVVHIDGLKVHVDRYDGQPDYSLDIAATFERFASETVKDYHVRMKDFPDMNHVEEQVLQCVAKLYPEQFKHLDAFCTQHRTYLDATIARFHREVNFYLSYLTFIRRFTDAGLRFSYPSITDDPGSIYAEDAFDLALAAKAVKDGNTVVCNDFRLEGPERIFVITGPNQGGKTTLARTIGQLSYLATLGCPVPAGGATLTLPDDIYTHFEREETLDTLHGKLDNELVRIHEILSRATPTSIIVMNESFSSTTVDDSLQIGAEVLERIIALDCVAVYVTFLDELASLHRACVSMVAEVAYDDPTRRTFKFTRRPADGLAHAAALADKYGLARDVLVRRIGQ